jgi:predicted nucleotidyltransferase
MISDEVLNEVKHRLVDRFHPDKIILFGSQARGTADDRSDVDILVVCEASDGRRSLTLAMDRALWGLRLARDIVVLTPEEYERDRQIPGTIARPAWLEGRILYENAG